jgi:hypothetical protein
MTEGPTSGDLATGADGQASPLRPARAFARLAATSLAACVVLAAVGYWPARTLGGITAMVVGLSIALLGGWAGLIAPVLAAAAGPRQQLNGQLLGLAARFGATMTLAVAALFSGLVPIKPMILWAAIGHSAVLAVDLAGLVRLLKRSAGVAT